MKKIGIYEHLLDSGRIISIEDIEINDRDLLIGDSGFGYENLDEKEKIEIADYYIKTWSDFKKKFKPEFLTVDYVPSSPICLG